jgi:hypothetical protein
MGTKKRNSTKRILETPPELTGNEQDLLWHMEHGYQLETDSPGSHPVLRRLRDDEVLRPPSANRSTIKSMQERGLITETDTRDPLKIIWRVNKKVKK